MASLVAVNGVLYGTAAGHEFNGLVTSSCVFKVTTSGKATVLHSFTSKGDGAGPQAALIYTNGLLYGTTKYGGATGNGVVFSIDPGSGKERVVYSFKHYPDGSQPIASLATMNGILYGTTFVGGKNGAGTIFSLTTSGKEKVLYNFKSGKQDGQLPAAGLTALKGTLYGTTSSCGVGMFACGGTVFAVTP